MKVKELPKNDRPRERLLRVGANNLTNQELLAIILKTGSKEKDVMDLSYDLLNYNFDLRYNLFVSVLVGKTRVWY